ncbi:hypothetical protein DFS34DRAFT_81650 [Phlyctochytrium arcticum]|nr:hypothetical protein DFS34DRAFT_81650 [Phlyctochytrium arcticum]
MATTAATRGSRSNLSQVPPLLNAVGNASTPGVRFAKHDAVATVDPNATLSTPGTPSSGKKKAAIGTTIAKQIMKGGKRPSGQPDLRLEDLDEAVLKKRLEALEAELGDYKAKCERHKQENDWYREEIETCQRDTAEYIAYLESKKSEKQSAIDQLIESSKLDLEAFMSKKKIKEQENEAKMEELRKQIFDLEDKIETKQQEVQSLSDVMSRRARHEADIAHLRKEMHESEQQHQARIAELERTLLEERIRVQKETDSKIREMESAAHEKAHKYLTTHISVLDTDNDKLSAQLKALIAKTQALLAQKANLEVENVQLRRDATVRQDVLNIRLQKVVDAEARRLRLRDRKREAGRKTRKEALERVVQLAERREREERAEGALQSTDDFSAPVDGPRAPTGRVLRKTMSQRPEDVADLVFAAQTPSSAKATMAAMTIAEGDLDWSDEEDDEYL